MSEKSPENVVFPLVALRNLVVFPGVFAAFRVGRPRSVVALEQATEGDGRLFVVAQREAAVEEPSPDDLFDVGVICEVRRIHEEETPDVRQVLVEGLERRRIAEHVQFEPYHAVRLEPFPDTPDEVPASLRREVRQLLASSIGARQTLSQLEALPDSYALDYAVAFNVDVSVEDKQKVLEEPSPLTRYRMLVPVLKTEKQIADAGRRIRDEAKSSVSVQERRLWLEERREDMERELAELTGSDLRADELRERIEQAGLPAEVRQEAERELVRLSNMPSGAPEYGVITDYLEWLGALPWNASTDAVVDLGKAREVLDRDHYDRREVKERILEYLSVRKLRPEREGALLCFVGAPGVGKTSMGRSIAEATGRRFHRISLGGVRDEAEVRGHRRTYVGALPGRIIRALRSVGVSNPVLLLDEIDKLQVSPMGDPASALLEVMDPEHNSSFVDSYLAVPFDLSRIMFIGTANTTDTIPPVLLDRLEVIELPGYSTEEKTAIARQYLLPKQVRAAGLEQERVDLEEGALELLVEGYTREAGVRELERQIAAVCRKVARGYLEGRRAYCYVDRRRVADLLGPHKYSPERDERSGRPGVCPTLAVSPAGGRLLLVEVTRVDGKGKLIVTGRVGEALRESAFLAYSFWKGRAERFGFAPSVLTESDFHVHFPGAGVAKGGTAVGLAVALAFASALADRPLAEGAAVLGEITLSGRVLRVDRVRERLAAASRAGIARVILPERNRPEVEAARDAENALDLEILYVKSIQEALPVGLPSAGAGSRP